MPTQESALGDDIFMLDCFLKKKERVNNDNSTLIEF